MPFSLRDYYSNPVFRSGVAVRFADASASFSYYGTEFDVDFDPKIGDELKSCVAALTAGTSIDDPELFTEGREHIRELLAVFDRYGFLTDTAWTRPDASLSGRAFWKEISSLSQLAKKHFPFPFCERLANGQLHRDVLVLYAVQYYHVVKHGPRIIAGALARAYRPHAQRILEQFLQEETGHDRLLATALVGAHISSEAIETSMPLPETFALTSYLQVLAEQEPLSFAATIFLMEEENSDFHARFVRASERAGLGEGFYGPIKQHAHINDGGDHGNISAELLENIELVLPEEALVVQKHLIGLIECLSEIDCALDRAAGSA